MTVEFDNDEEEKEVAGEVLDNAGDAEPDYTDPREGEVESAQDDWAPDYKFKVMDKEYEIDESLRGSLTQENYDQVKELHEKAYGLDHIKQKKTALEEDNRRLMEVEQNFQKQNQSFGYMGNLIKNKDYHTLFNELKIPEQDVMKYSLDRVNYQDLSQEEKTEYDGNIESKQRLRNLEMQNQQFQQQLQQQTVHARTSELESHLASEQVQNVVSAFDERAGKPGAFREEVVRRGQMAYYSTGKDISVQDAVGEVVKMYGNAPVAAPAESHQAPGEKPVILNVKSGGGSPARKLPRSIDDLKKAAAAFQ